MNSFHQFLTTRIAGGGFSTEDTLASLLPLMRAVQGVHERGEVAPLEGVDALTVDGTKVGFDENHKYCEPRDQLPLIEEVLAAKFDDAEADLLKLDDPSQVKVLPADAPVGATGAEDPSQSKKAQQAAEASDPAPEPVLPSRPGFVPGYRCWEQLVGHHDPLTDIFCLGQLLASVALGLDFNDARALGQFARNRRNLFVINDSVHPVVARVIVRMTELDRGKRVPELSSVIHALENYRQQEIEVSVNPDEIEGFQSRDLQGKQQLLLDRLQTRLIEVSRRNRLLHFRTTGQALDLTQASVPLSFDYHNIRDDQILVSDDRLLKPIAGGDRISLNKYLNFEEALYLPGQLTRIYRQSRRDLAEFGFVQLRLVLCMLDWSDLTEKPAEQYTSPLLLVPVQLIRKRSVRDVWELEPLSHEAEINPVVRYLFKKWYAIELPEMVDLQATGLDALYRFMSEAISASEPAVELAMDTTPETRELLVQARRRLERYRKRAGMDGKPAEAISQQGHDQPERDIDSGRNLSLVPRYEGDLDAGEEVRREEEGGSAGTNARTSEKPGMNPSTSRSTSTNTRRSTSTSTSTSRSTSRNRRESKSTERGNPYNWRFDLCRVTLANFRYRKMSLVRDYERLVEEQPPSATFDAVFSLSPRPTASVRATPPLVERFDVVPCDPTQAQSIGQARADESYIIQGPPGTGKSQTITNLIADYAARGKRVLFVCEKRAAIDVVFARLRQCGLGELCCLIHDSQTDKKAFVMDLKETSESFLKRQRNGLQTVTTRRDGNAAGLESAKMPLDSFAATMRDSLPLAGTPTSSLLERAIALRPETPELTEARQEQLPAWRSWNEGRSAIESAVESLKRQQPDGVLARHPLRNLAASLTDDSTPLQTVTDGIRQAKVKLRQLGESPDAARELETGSRTFAELRRLVEYCRLIGPLARSQALGLFDANSAAARELEKSRLAVVERERVLAAQRDVNSAWRERIPRHELPSVIELANELSKKWVPVIRPSWWRLRSYLNRSYDFASHPIRRTLVSVLNNLRDEYAAEDAVFELKRQVAHEFGWLSSWDEMSELAGNINAESASWPEWLGDFHQRLAASAGDGHAIASHPSIATMAGHATLLQAIRTELDEFLTGYETLTIDEIHREMDAISGSLDKLPDYLACLRQLAGVPEDVRVALQRMDLAPTQIEGAAAARTIRLIGRERRDFGDFDQSTRRHCLAALTAAHKEWMEINAEFVREQVRQRFLENVRASDDAPRKPSSEDEAFQKSYREGRKVLEHEFGKQMRYKSIRDLVNGESGAVIRDLKPIWLMSPLSVSDTVPLTWRDEHPLFDVVIFDEASQITLESAVPALYRARQTIVVGDQQQLPPTSFFATRSDDDDDEITFEDEGETVTYDLESSSLLNHASRNLASTMLGWHYRSRDEALISFSNHAFYNGRLLTIPEEQILRPNAGSLSAASADAATANAAALDDRPISFHLMEVGLYEKRRNRPEAEYIAELIRQLLTEGRGRTLGVIAFSESQQDEIETAIERLADSDEAFSRLLESEYAREDEGQFTGLLIKNLENIQGDERDIVILSICYGPDADGRMLMNFGPINQSGGEKRLNVAFTRAKHHMAVISSIRGEAITNEHNVGARCLRNYLRYAAAISSGDAASAQNVLRELAPAGEGRSLEKAPSPVLKDIARALAEHRLIADFNVGHSEFRCDIGLRRDGDSKYRLAILVDAGDYYQRNPDTLDREMSRPRLLEVFGWRVRHLLMKDWLADPRREVRQIVAACDDAVGAADR